MPDLTFHELQHIQKLLQQQGSLKYIFDDFVKKTGNLLTQWNEYPSGDIWSKNQSVQKAIEEEMQILRTKLTANIENYTTDAWNRSHLKSDELVDGFVKNLALNDVVKNGMYARNNEVLQAFLKRKVEGESLSQRVWKIVEGAKTNIEFYLESGLSTGRSAALISQDIRQLLQEPDRRFHRIRNADGKLVPSAPMADYHPGQGIYRSSYKNALRLAATNTNEMYRLTDNERWQKLDFVIGYKVSRAKNNYGPCAICDAMVGNYPKTYVFTGNHPFCICYAVPILMDEDAFIDALVEDDFSKVKYIDDIPAGGRKYIQDLIDNKKLSTDSYLLKRNKGFFDGSGKNIVPQKNVIEPVKPVPVKFIPAKTIQEAEAWAKKNLNVEFVNFKGLDIDVANDINRSTFNIKTLMPDIKTKGIGNAQQANRAMKAEIVAEFRKTEWYKTVANSYGQAAADKRAIQFANSQVSNVGSNTVAWSTNRDTVRLPGGILFDVSKYKGVFVNEKYGKKASIINNVVLQSEKSGFYTKEAKNFGYIMSHEIGHEIDKTIGFRNSDVFKAIYKKETDKGIDYIIENLSKYGATAGGKASAKPLEFIAESWAEFVTSPNPRRIAKEVGEAMLKEYHTYYMQGSGIKFDEWRNEILKTLTR